MSLKNSNITNVFFVIAVGIFTFILGFIFGSKKFATKTPDNWMWNDLRFDTVFETFDKIILDKKKRAMINVASGGSAFLFICWSLCKCFPYAAQYLHIQQYRPRTTSWLKQTLETFVVSTPIVNETVLLISCVIGTIVFMMIIATLQFTGTLKWLRALAVNFWFNVTFLLFGDPRDNFFRHSIEARVMDLYTDTFEQISYAKSSQEAHRYGNWKEIRKRSIRLKTFIESDANNRAEQIADRSWHRETMRHHGHVREAINDEHDQKQNVYGITKLIKHHIL